MIAINAPSIASAWERAVRHVLAKGVPVTTEDGEETLEADEIIVKVDNPLWNLLAIPDKSPYGERLLEQYKYSLLMGRGSGFAYTYHDRLFGYVPYSDYEGGGVDQIDEAIWKLRTSVNPDLANRVYSRRAICITWQTEDTGEKNPPCLQWIQFLVRDNKLQMKVLFRSNDVLLAMHANMYALVHLQQYVATSLGLPVGSYTHIVTVPHIYYKRDANEVQKWSSTSA